MASTRELRRSLTRALGEFRPQAIRQILEMDLGLDMPVFRELISGLLKQSCSRFLMHARKWTPYPEFRPLDVMCDYHNLWEGWHCTELYSFSENQKIKYFMDRNITLREQEMEASFIMDP